MGRVKDMDSAARRERCLTMVRKLFPDFDDSRQYVLWLVCEFDSRTWLWGAQGTVTVVDPYGNEVQYLSACGLDGASPIVRAPYGEFDRRMVCLEKGRRRTFGIPLVFDSLADMQATVGCVKVHWDLHLLEPCYLQDGDTKPLNVRFLSIDSVHKVWFDGADTGEGHWYELRCVDTLFGMGHEDEDEQLVKDYGFVLGIEDYRVVDEHDGLYVDDSDISVIAPDDVDRPFTRREEEVVGQLGEVPFDGLLAMFDACMYKPVCVNEWLANRYYYERDVTLVGGTCDVMSYAHGGR